MQASPQEISPYSDLKAIRKYILAVLLSLIMGGQFARLVTTMMIGSALHDQISGKALQSDPFYRPSASVQNTIVHQPARSENFEGTLSWWVIIVLLACSCIHIKTAGQVLSRLAWMCAVMAISFICLWVQWGDISEFHESTLTAVDGVNITLAVLIYLSFAAGGLYSYLRRADISQSGIPVEAHPQYPPPDREPGRLIQNNESWIDQTPTP